jgi:tetratricopeptide (TPR) repeat protein
LLCLNPAANAAREGRTENSKDLLNQVQGPGFEQVIEYWRMYLALVTDQLLSHDQFADATTRVHSLEDRRDLAELRRNLFIAQEQFTQALAVAYEEEQLDRNAGIDVAPAVSAFLLAKLGRNHEATVAVEEALVRLPRMHPARRPYLYLAQALRELGRQTEATSHARAAYQQAWADDPPNSHHWNLRSARQLLEDMDEPIPNLPTINAIALKIPLEDEVRAFLER